MKLLVMKMNKKVVGLVPDVINAEFICEKQLNNSVNITCGVFSENSDVSDWLKHK